MHWSREKGGYRHRNEGKYSKRCQKRIDAGIDPVKDTGIEAEMD
jgi:hypothetical protein